MGLGLGGFGAGLIEGYAATSRVLDEKARTKLLQNADTRAAEKWALDKKSVEEVNDLTNQIATTVQNRSDDMKRLQAPLPGATGVTPPPDAAAAPAPAAGLQPPPAAPAPAAPVTPPVRAANAAPVAPVAPAAPAPQRNSYGQLPGEEANDAALNADVPVTNIPAPPGQPTSRLAAIDVPAQPGAAPAPPNYADLIAHARETTRLLTPMYVKLLAKTHPDKAVELARNFTDEAAQDRMTKTTLLAGLAKVNAADPAIPKLLPDVYPGYVAGSYRAMPPDPQGNPGYGQFTVQAPDGSTKEVGFTPALIDSMLTTALSPKVFLDHELAVKEQGRKEQDTQSEIKSRDAAEKMGIRKQNEVEKQWNDTAPDREALRTYHQRAGAGQEESRLLSAETRATLAKNTVEKGGLEYVQRMGGISAQTPPDDPARVENGKLYGKLVDAATANGMDLGAASMSRLYSVRQQLLGGDISGLKKADNGELHYLTPDGKAMVIPSSLLTTDFLKRLREAQPAARGVTPPDRTGPVGNPRSMALVP